MALAALALLPLGAAQPNIIRENGKLVAVFYGAVPAVPRLHINSHGPVTVEGGISKDFTYSVKVALNARTEAEARRVLRTYAVRADVQGQWLVITAPGGAAMPVMNVKTPRLQALTITTSDGVVNAAGVDGNLDVDTGGGELFADHIRGDCRLITGAGDVRVGEIGGTLRVSTGGGKIQVRSVHGEATLETNGGDVSLDKSGGPVRAETGGGGVHIGSAGGTVSATSGGGEIIVEKAGGIVTLRNMAGPVQVGSAAGVRCESMSGGVRLANITGPMRVSTSMGSILASLLAGRLGDSFLATGNGDITVLIPSNVGVTIQAQNQMSDSLRRIVSDFREIQPRRQGTRLVAEGSVNGGGPLLQISGTGGTVFIKRQQ
jgi:DUF4097 and DUF4098 domain-containing protein YvlB